ncbi:MAG: hypothetical protein EBX47_07520 [Synechococcaceae bacterium WB8_1B_057]|nr:hypothetical protein [Synechococcaceae bacterium WB8_1B_057]
MATLNELGRNSASITYGPFATGADYWPTFALFDQWIRNDAMQGIVTCNSTNITGVGTIFTTQLRAGDVIMVAGQLRTIATVTSDVAATVTAAFNPAISVSSTMYQINNTFGGTNGALAGTVAISVRNNVAGVVSVTAGSQVVTGVGTFFLSDCTNSVTTAGLTGTVAVDTSGNVTGTATTFATGADGSQNRLQTGDSVLIGSAYFVVTSVTNDTTAVVTPAPAVAISAGASIAKATNGVAGRTIVINGRVRQVLSITSNTQLTVNAPLDFTDSNEKIRTYPRGTLSISAGSQTVSGSGTNFSWDCVTGDQIWIGDELRTFSFSSGATTVATITDYAGFTGATAVNVMRQAINGIGFFRDDTYFTGSGSNFINELRVGDEIMVDGTKTIVSAVISSTSFRVNFPFSHTCTNSNVWKLKKVHGYVLEGTREGAASGNKLGVSTTATAVAAAGTTIISVASTASFTQFGIVKVVGGGGPAVALAGQVTVSGTAVTGVNCLFLTQLHIGAEICVAGQYAVVSAIASDNACTLVQSLTVAAATPIYRVQPLYTFIAAVGINQITLGTPLRQSLHNVGAANPPLIYTHSASTDFIEFVYSAPNYAADNVTGGGTATLSNISLDRKYFGLRYFPQQQGSGSGTTFALAGSAYNLTVYERWAAGYAGSNGVGINQADLSGNTTTSATGNDWYSNDLTSMSANTGGFLYLFAHPRYVVIQGKTFSNSQQRWVGCVEFERAQPEDTGTGLGSTSGITFNVGAPVLTTGGQGSNAPALNIAPWPCFAYFNGERFPIGGSQRPTLPLSQTTGVHGMLFATPRVRCSTGDLTGQNAHIYSAATITTGAWGHLLEFMGSGAYQTLPVATGQFTAQTAGFIPQLHLGQIVPVYTNVYNSKRFMFSPVVVLGPKYDPDIRGRIYGLKVIPSALGTLMDTVSVTIDSQFFYNAAGTATDHWVLTSSVTTRKSTLAATVTVSQQWRSLEDNVAQAANTDSAFVNSFRFALPA